VDGGLLMERVQIPISIIRFLGHDSVCQVDSFRRRTAITLSRQTIQLPALSPEIAEVGPNAHRPAGDSLGRLICSALVLMPADISESQPKSVPNVKAVVPRLTCAAGGPNAELPTPGLTCGGFCPILHEGRDGLPVHRHHTPQKGAPQ
jgi:hypothetical protein